MTARTYTQTRRADATGRTRAAILETLLRREYVVRVGSKNRRFARIRKWKLHFGQTSQFASRSLPLAPNDNASTLSMVPLLFETE